MNIVALHVVLYQPEIPANTGNIARTCAATDTTLHLIRPLGFSTDDKMLKRAGLDYWEFVNVVYHDSLEELFEAYEKGKFFFITKFGQKPHTSFDYSNTEEDFFFVFGRETSGRSFLCRIRRKSLPPYLSNQMMCAAFGRIL